MWIIYINGEESIAAQGALDEINCHQTPRIESKVKIRPCRRTSYQRTDLEEICSIFDQVISVVAYLEFCLPDKPSTPKNTGEFFWCPQRKLWKEALFVKYNKNKCFSLLLDPIPIKSLPEVTKVLHSLIATSIKEGDCYDAWKFVALHCVNGISYIKGIDFDQWQMLTYSESTLLSWICIDSLPIF